MKLSLRRGFSLAGTLCFIAVMVTLAFTAASYSVTNLNLNKRLVNSKVASDLAESACNLALARILEDPSWRGSLEHQAGGGLGQVSFEEAQARDWKIPRSVNNLQSANAVAGVARTVAPESVQIVALGRYNGVTKQIEQVVSIPTYRYALVSNGPIHSQGDLLVAGLDNPALLSQGVSQLRPDQLRGGYLASNSADDQAISLESSPGHSSKITGSVEAVGGIQLGDDVEVLGAVQEGSPVAPLPAFRISDYDPKGRSDLIEESDAQRARLVVQGATRREGSLTITQGLQFQQGYLYVHGDLTIDGGIQGTGALFVTGDLTVRGLSTFVGDSREAVLVGGNVHIEGSDSDKSVFQGLIYSEGDVRAKNVTLVGAVVAHRPQATPGSPSSGSQIQLEQVNLLANAAAIRTEWSSGFDPKATFGGDTSVEFLADPGQRMEPSVGVANSPKDFYDSVKDEFTLTPSDHTLEKKTRISVPEFAAEANGRFYNFSSVPELIALLQNPAHTESIRAAGFQVPPTMKWESEEVILPNGERVMQLVPKFVSGWTSVTDASDPKFLGQVSFLTGLKVDMTWDQYMPQMIANYNELYQKNRPPWMRQDSWGFNFDPNKFLQLTEKTRRLLVRETVVRESP